MCADVATPGKGGIYWSESGEHEKVPKVICWNMCDVSMIFY
jgi:hypothetical protein